MVTDGHKIPSSPERKQCILYRRGGELRLKCTDLKKNKKGYSDLDVDLPEIQDPNFSQFWTKPCDIKVSEGRIKRWRLPWKQFHQR